jgi:hypothetical protein
MFTKTRFLAFGVGLDPRQAKVFGPRLGPFLVACIIGVISFSSVGIAAGYPGGGLNPARCFAMAVARGEFKREFHAICLKLTYLLEFTNYRPVDLVGWANHRRSISKCRLPHSTSISSTNSLRTSCIDSSCPNTRPEYQQGVIRCSRRLCTKRIIANCQEKMMR